jgi:hypothetical protein
MKKKMCKTNIMTTNEDEPDEQDEEDEDVKYID